MKKSLWMMMLSMALVAGLAACSDDGSSSDADGSGAGADTDMGGDDAGMDTTGDDMDSTTGPMCEDTAPCERSRDCLDAGLTGFVCDQASGCCIEDTNMGGDDTGTMEACGDITFEGECDGDTVRWCQEDALQEIDCTGYIDGVTATCGFISDDFGYFCVIPEGDACLFNDADGNPVPQNCGGTDPGCVLGAESTACTSDVGTCTAPAEGQQFAPTCFGDVLGIACINTQPLGYDCTSFGGTCAEGACTGLGEGEDCDGDIFLCGEGFTCEGMTDMMSGTCTAE